MKRIVLLYVFYGFILGGCNGNDENPPPKEVMVYFSTQSMPNSSLKSTAEPDEDLINRIIMCGVDNLGKVVEVYPAILTLSSSGIPLTISEDVISLYAIANPSTGIEAALPSATVSGLMSLTVDFTSAPQSPFLMSGKGNVIGSNVNIELIRAVAKIEVIGQNDFRIESVTVKNTPDKGFVFKQETIVAPTSSARVNYPVNTDNSTVYVAENSKDNSTELVVTGTYLDKQASYTIVLKNNGTPVDVARNTYYKVNVSPNTVIDCTVEITILEWEDVTTDDNIIPDENFES